MADILPTIEEKYTDEQAEIIALVYDKAKVSAEAILKIEDLSSMVKVVKIIAEIIKLLETITIHKVKITGKMKKHIALLLTRRLIIEIVKDENTRHSMLEMHQNMGENVLETMVDVSRNLNVQEAATTCCNEIGKSCCMAVFTSIRS